MGFKEWMSGQVCKGGHCTGYRREKFGPRKKKKKKAVHLHFIWRTKGNREAWTLIGSDVFLKTLVVLEKRQMGEQGSLEAESLSRREKGVARQRHWQEEWRQRDG